MYRVITLTITSSFKLTFVNLNIIINDHELIYPYFNFQFERTMNECWQGGMNLLIIHHEREICSVECAKDLFKRLIKNKSNQTVHYTSVLVVYRVNVECGLLVHIMCSVLCVTVQSETWNESAYYHEVKLLYRVLTQILKMTLYPSKKEE